MNPLTQQTAKLRAWQEDQGIRFSVPPVCSVDWDDHAWINWVDWSLPCNAEILARYLPQEKDPTCVLCDAGEDHEH